MLFLIDVSRQHVTLKVVNHHQIDQFVHDNFFVCASRPKFHHFCCGTIAHNDEEYRVYTATRESDDTHS